MKKLAKLFLEIAFLFFTVLLLSSCSIIQKTKSKQKAEVSVLETEQSTIEVKSDLEAKSEIQSLIENQLIGLLSAINWQYQGKDSAEIEIIQTSSGIKIKTKGNAIADLKTNSESQTNKNHTKSESKSEISHKLEVESELKKDFSKEVKKEDLDKTVKRADVSIWIYVVGLILAIICIVLYWFFGRPNDRKPLDNSSI